MDAATRDDMPLDVVIIGAGLSGIGAAAQLRQKAPRKSLAVLEARSAIGGTWDLFRYPGVRSDSDMHTLGYACKPWPLRHSIASGAEIRRYIEDAAQEFGIAPLIRYNHRVLAADWDSGAQVWRLSVSVDGGAPGELRCRFLHLCSGYYDYGQGYTPELPGIGRFRGTVVHPQHWPEELDYNGKAVVIIGSGATAVTLLPAMAQSAARVTMLQRSPGYVISRPTRDAVSSLVRFLLPKALGYRMLRWKHLHEQRWLFRTARKHPERVRRQLIRRVAAALGNADYARKHFAPRYDPWDERLCLVPDNDLFKAIRSGKAGVETDHIDRFEENGIRLKSGKLLVADVVVTATGLNLNFAGGLPLALDGKPVRLPEHVTYRSCMIDGVPNLAFAFGYTNSSFTLRTDLVADFVSRLLNHMDATGRRVVRPLAPPDMARRPWFDDFLPGYIKRAIETLPQQGDAPLWRNSQDYEADRRLFAEVPLTDPSLAYE
ncbi:NAD(P)/FAD-dependent oxidoreductase [Novosphingobium sp. AAP93]|uniref:flavin-containing monooxygenase n=1 Tax=Novosphingobium sp. AAP93 TaxID=1523427 RepID=UPI0006B8E602|nr:NAD(P)/FAD-dependent oxidoreductase [Novosphingobium sp. AAP93]KPF89512.1 FAD-containing monooxygenase EthA [Novosphingobium sp. AAP93]